MSVPPPRDGPPPSRFLCELALRMVEDYERADIATEATPDDPGSRDHREVVGGALLILLMLLGGAARVGDTVYEADGDRLRVRRGVQDLMDCP